MAAARMSNSGKRCRGKRSRRDRGRYPEPKWLGMIQHDMMMFDHGMPRADGTLSADQRPEADVNIEFAGSSKMAAAVAGARVAVSCGERKVRNRLSSRCGQSHAEHRFRAVSGRGGGDQPA